MKNLYPIFLLLAVFVVVFRKPYKGDHHEGRD